MVWFESRRTHDMSPRTDATRVSETRRGGSTPLGDAGRRRTRCTHVPRKNIEDRRVYQREYYWRKRKHVKRDSKRRWIERLGGKCTRCGYNKCLEALHFHHVDPSTKSFAVFDTWRSDRLIEEELKKCILVCANCHAELHQMVT